VGPVLRGISCTWIKYRLAYRLTWLRFPCFSSVPPDMLGYNHGTVNDRLLPNHYILTAHDIDHLDTMYVLRFKNRLSALWVSLNYLIYRTPFTIGLSSISPVNSNCLSVTNQLQNQRGIRRRKESIWELAILRWSSFFKVLISFTKSLPPIQH
jgi:hypothetical protein